MEFSADNDHLRIEEDKAGKLIIMPPVDFNSGASEGIVTALISNWWLSYQKGKFFSPSTGFRLPDGDVDGFSITEQVRLSNTETPILILTAKDMAQDRITGLKKGADDYLTKPFNLEELLLRVNNLLRRSQRVKGEALETFEFGNNRINFETFEAVTFRGEHQMLTKKEAMLLKLLVERKNEVVSRNQILQAVWGYDVFPSTRTIDNFILAFRKYFEEDAKNPRFFHSIRGVGYKFTM